MSSPLGFSPPETLLTRRAVLAAGAGMAVVGKLGAAPADGIPTLRATRFDAAPDGRTRGITGYNGQYPGPPIRVKEGELLRVRVVNGLDVPTSVHWHGMHQPGTWQMDGVENISRPPIPPGSEFVYEFTATPAGTHWYHSHVGNQYSDGLFGPLIVEENTPIAAYDRDEIVFINDWFRDPADTLLARIVRESTPMPGMKGMKDMPGMGGMPGMAAMKGMRDVGDVPFESALINGKGRGPGRPDAPLTTFSAKPGERLRQRLINSSSTYAFRFQVDGHPLTVIAADGAPIVPVEVDNLVLDIGERYDVLLTVGPAGASWVRAATLEGDETRAVLRSGPGAGEPPPAPLKWGKRMLMPAMLRSPKPVRLAENPREIPLLLGGSMKPYQWSINGQYFPKADPIRLKADEPVRFVFRNPTGMDHPFHLHGHYFHVLGEPGKLNLTDPPRKDTVTVPAKGGMVVQWVATNPGKWFFHCHIEWHIATGMGRVIEIE